MKRAMALAWAVDPLPLSVFLPPHWTLAAAAASTELLVVLSSLPHADSTSTLATTTLRAAPERLRFT